MDGGCDVVMLVVVTLRAKGADPSYVSLNLSVRKSCVHGVSVLLSSRVVGERAVHTTKERAVTNKRLKEWCERLSVRRTRSFGSVKIECKRGR